MSSSLSTYCVPTCSGDSALSGKSHLGAGVCWRRKPSQASRRRPGMRFKGSGNTFGVLSFSLVKASGISGSETQGIQLSPDAGRRDTFPEPGLPSAHSASRYYLVPSQGGMRRRRGHAFVATRQASLWLRHSRAPFPDPEALLFPWTTAVEVAG